MTDTVTVADAATEQDWRQAARLLDDYVSWLGRAVGVDPLAEQPSFAIELASLSEHYRGAGARLWLAHRGDRALGTVALRLDGDGAAELKRLYVDPAGRGLGVGGRLLDRALATADDERCDVVWLETVDGVMDSAIRLYRDRGFATVAEQGRTIPVPGMLTMERRRR